MADVTKVKASDGTIYDINDVNDYTKDETDALLAGKADVGVSYTKAEDDALLAAKADTTSVESALALKANVVDVYSKTEADNLLAGKADTGVSYTKAEDDALLLAKADAADVYTITQTDALLDGKAGVDDSSTTATMATWSASKLNVEFQGKADVGDVYDKTEVYTKAEVDALIGVKGNMRFNPSTGRYEYWDGTQWSEAKLVYEVEQDGSYTLGSALKKLYEDITGDNLAPTADSTLTYVHDGATEFLHIGYDNNSNAYRYFTTYISSSGRVETMCLNPSSTSPYAKKCDSTTTTSMESNTQWSIVRVVL